MYTIVLQNMNKIFFETSIQATHDKCFSSRIRQNLNKNVFILNLITKIVSTAFQRKLCSPFPTYLQLDTYYSGLLIHRHLATSVIYKESRRMPYLFFPYNKTPTYVVNLMYI